jgi:hypothetical protein
VSNVVDRGVEEQCRNEPVIGDPAALAGTRRRVDALRDGLLIGASLGGSIGLVLAYMHSRVLGTDYRSNAWAAGRALFHGMHLYVPPTSAEVKRLAMFDWGPASAVLLAPLALLPAGIASPLVVAACVASVLATLYICGVRDWRVYCIVMTWPFVVVGWVFGNIELPLTLCLAVAWRCRDRPRIVALAVAVMLSVKIILWPAVIWLLATRRYPATLYTVVWALAINLIVFAVVGFNELGRYLALLPAVAKFARPRSVGVISLAVHLGAGRTIADGIVLVVAAGVGAGCVVAGRRGEDLLAFALAIVVCVVATPIVDAYYYTLLVVPVALTRPRFGQIWAVPLVLWLSLGVLGPWNHVGTTVVCLLTVAVLVTLAFGRQKLRTALRPGRAAIPAIDRTTT